MRHAAGAHAAAELGLFAGDQFGVVASGFFEGAAAHEDVASAELGDAGRVDPVEIEDAVVDGCFGMNLAAMAPDGDDRGVLEHGSKRGVSEIRMQDGIAIEKENELAICRAPSGVAPECCGSSLRVENDHLRAIVCGEFGAAVFRVGIDVNELRILQAGRVADGFKTARQTLAFVASDDDD